MSFDYAIYVKNISKTYSLYNNPFEKLKEILFGRKKVIRSYEKINSKSVLKNISFTIGLGETVGIIGRNGSGKSTLLKIICGTLLPDSGKKDVSGRVAALLELGSGFNADFTGFENIFMYAAALGMSNEEIKDNLTKIIEFADIGTYINNPIKTYSSGMVVRLAFSVAIHTNPQVLIVDEALSVGDELFQRKCFSKIESLKREGTTILFVSHSAFQVIELCNRVMLIDSGELLFDGNPKKAVDAYHKLIYAPLNSQSSVREDIKNGFFDNEANAIQSENVTLIQNELFDSALISQSKIEYENRGAKISNVRIEDGIGKIVNNLNRGENYTYAYDVEFDADSRYVRFALLIKYLSGLELGGATSANQDKDRVHFIQTGSKFTIKFSFLCNLNPALYFMNAGVLAFDDNGSEFYLHRIIDAYAFRVLELSDNKSTGLVFFDIESEIEKHG